MGEYFKGWKRQIALRLLVLTGLFMIGFMRSLVVVDRYDLFMGYTSHHLISGGGFLCWISEHNQHQIPLHARFQSNEWNPDFEFHPIKFGRNDQRICTIILPYSLIAMPLALLTTWLLLSKAKITQSPIVPPSEKP